MEEEKLTPEQEERLAKKRKIGFIAKNALFVVLGALAVFIIMLVYQGTKISDAEQAKIIEEKCNAQAKSEDGFYCCAGCMLEGYSEHTYLIDGDICQCRDEAKGQITLWDEPEKTEVRLPN